MFKHRLSHLVLLMAISFRLLAADDDVFERILAPATSSSVRKSEASVIGLRDGRLLVAYTDFYTISAKDDAPAHIVGRHSADSGATWSKPFVMVENTAGRNVMSVSLLRLQSGEIAMTYMFKNSHEDSSRPGDAPDSSILFRVSRDEGKTFSEPITITPRKSFWVMNNDRLVQLKSGRLLAPCQRLDNWPMIRHSFAQVLYSDDNGKNWKGSDLVDIRSNRDGADEPGLIELNDGRILMYFRTGLGSIYQSFSSDAGVSWSTPEAAILPAPMSPALIKRIPSTGHLLIIWNHTLPGDTYNDRFPLTAAISKDEGRTWQIRDLDTDVRFTFAYPSIAFYNGRVVITYWAAHGSWYSLKLRSVPVSWFYQQENDAQ